jgi:DNA-binding LacI/PurR family transcriptional regulator
MSSDGSAPTIFDVADLPGVSVKTVSRVTAAADVPPATRTRGE